LDLFKGLDELTRYSQDEPDPFEEAVVRFRRLCRWGLLIRRCWKRNSSAVQRILEPYEAGTYLYPFVDEAPARSCRVVVTASGRKTFVVSLVDFPTTHEHVTEDAKRLWLADVHWNELQHRRQALETELHELVTKFGIGGGL
jgi:hypothetical protein